MKVFVFVDDLECVGSPLGGGVLDHSPATGLDGHTDLHVGEVPTLRGGGVEAYIFFNIKKTKKTVTFMSVPNWCVRL